MAHVLPGLFVPAHISKVLPIVTTHAPHSDRVDWLGSMRIRGYEEMGNTHWVYQDMGIWGLGMCMLEDMRK